MAVWIRKGRSVDVIDDPRMDESSESALLWLTIDKRVLAALGKLARADLSPIARISGTEETAEDYKQLADAIAAEEELSRREALQRAHKTKRHNDAAWQSPADLLVALRAVRALCTAKGKRAQVDRVLKRAMNLKRATLLAAMRSLIGQVERAVAVQATSVRLVVDPAWL